MESELHKIDSATEYQRVKKVISKKNQPGKIMRFLMNGLESYRQARKLGWSRPWNKYNLTVFQTFKLKPLKDDVLINQITELLKTGVEMPSSARRFTEELLEDEKHLMGFLFVHDYMKDGQLYEGVTFSLGRVNDKRFRDRIDLIFESPVIEGRSQGLSRIRVFIDPYMGAKEPLWSCVVTDKLSTPAFHLFDDLAECSWAWAEQENRVWNHWTSDYIDYFAPRKKELEMSYFYQADKPSSRIHNKAEQAA